MRITVLGGGGFRVPLLHDALDTSTVQVDEFVLQDVSPERLTVMSAVLDDPAVRTTTSLDEALDGADIVLSAVRVGGVEGRVADERIALELGVLGQETVGAGGLRYARRAVPAAVSTARRIAELAPSAWTVSMTNPAGLITEVMARELGERVIGVCDSPTALVRRAAAAAGVPVGASLGRLDGFAVDYAGINHLGWLRSLVVDEADVLPALVRNPAALSRFEEGRLFGADLVAALGVVPNEYLYWYYAPRESLSSVVAAGRTRGEHVRAQQAAFYAAALASPHDARALWEEANGERNRSYFSEIRSGERDEVDVAAGGYEAIAVAVVEALTGGAPATVIANVPNGATIPQLPADLVIEVACEIDSAGARPLPVAPLSLHELGLVAQVRASERAIASAALNGSATDALAAFALHPLVGSIEAARALAGS